jgi:anthranilate synthase component I
MIEIYPSIKDFKDIAANSDNKKIIPVWCEIIADTETPVSAYHKVCKDKKYSFLLESVEGGESIARYSFIGTDPLYVLKSDQTETCISNIFNNEVLMKADNPYDLLEKFLTSYTVHDSELPFSPGVVGYFSYDSVKYIEPTVENAFNKVEECTSFPNAYFMIAGSVLVFDHVKHKIYIVSNVLANKDTIDQDYKNAVDKIKLMLSELTVSHNLTPLNMEMKNVQKQEVSSNITKEEWINAINCAKEHIKAGNIFQVVLSQRFCIENISHPFTIYRALRSINPSPYLYYLNFNDFQIIGSSPEIMVKCSRERIAELRPIAGTRKRGLDLEEDLVLEKELLDDPKERAEHIMLVDLGRNDLGRVCEYGTVKVKRLMSVEKYSHVQHIVSDVRGKLRDNLNSIDLVKACFPAGTVSGAPKIRAMEIIYDLEKAARGPYAGCIGYFGFNNEVNTAITIRTMLVRNNKIFVQAGAGIVADSDPETEYVETQNKAAALVQALTNLSD